MPAINNPKNPTWYGDIRNLFTQGDIGCMRAQGLDLSTYSSVRTHAPEIYQQVASGNMPLGGPRWTESYVNTFHLWMDNGYPKGNPVLNASKQNVKSLDTVTAVATRIRKDVKDLLDPEKRLLIAAFEGIMALDVDDPNSYFVQAGYHWLPAPNTFCQHHVPGFLPWHRAYLLSFEDALRSVPGCESVTLPYWDIEKPFPEFLKTGPFASYTLPKDIGYVPAPNDPPFTTGDKTERYSYPKIQQNLITNGVYDDITRAVSSQDWEDFNGYFAGAAHNTLISAHDSGHDSIGYTMANQPIAAFDPVFWFFHANWDRLFWNWQNTMGAMTLNGLLSTIHNDPLSYQTFTDPAVGNLQPFNITAAETIDIGVDYLASETKQTIAATTTTTMRTKTKGSVLASENFSVHPTLANVRIKGVDRLKIPGSFKVHLLKDGKTIATKSFFQPSEVEKCENCVKNAVVHFDFELPYTTVSSGDLSVWIEPRDKSEFGDHFPHELMGYPTVNVRLLLRTE